MKQNVSPVVFGEPFRDAGGREMRQAHDGGKAVCLFG